ncbi:ankyrin repeat-containing protein ITN1-like [Neltuma alba]|uniref:ankyrin repeat-containing protein ITN1-like n=1 Tax=Neltuma alba TaxID=207710 RepID=UPI0010A484BF|nr:ankyrin repeat-containing protein ITN1-like [Prosopis alba]
MALKDAVQKWIRNKGKEYKKIKFFKSTIWVLQHFELAGQSIYEFLGVRQKKQKHTWSCQITDEILHAHSVMSPGTPSFLKMSTNKDGERIETPLMIAAKNGVVDIVKKALKKIPSSINIDDVNDEGKNIVLLAAEKKQTKVYEFLCKPEILALTGSLFQQVDNDGNSALHLAARYGGGRNLNHHGEAFLMQWEFKWFEYVRRSMRRGVFSRYNKKLESPDDIFKETHKDLITQRDEEWLSKTSGACSVVSTLIATVAFATAASVPGGFDQNHGFPLLIHKQIYQFFVAMSLAALCFSLIATILLLSLATARFNVVQFYIDLPFRLFLGMSTMFISILCMWISFCASHSFLLVDKARKVYIPIYIIISIPATIYAITNFPVFWNLLTTSFSKLPAPSHNSFPARTKPPEKDQKSACADVSSKTVKICEDYEK